MSQLEITHVVANGDCAITFYFKESPQRLSAIHQLSAVLLQEPLPHLINVIPVVADITLVFDQNIESPEHIIAAVEQLIEQLDSYSMDITSHLIPVCYHPQVAPDLEKVCDHLSLKMDELIEFHSQTTFQVSMLGFLPGFAYLDDNDQRLRLPRKATPAINVPAGSIAIAGTQTGIYAMSSPGGWHVIGRTIRQMVDWSKQQPMLLNPLDRVQFEPISLTEFEHLT